MAVEDLREAVVDRARPPWSRAAGPRSSAAARRRRRRAARGECRAARPVVLVDQPGHHGVGAQVARALGVAGPGGARAGAGSGHGSRGGPVVEAAARALPAPWRAGRRTATRGRSGASWRWPPSWPSTPSVRASMRRASIDWGGIVSRFISCQWRERGSPKSISTWATSSRSIVTSRSSMYQRGHVAEVVEHGLGVIAASSGSKKPIAPSRWWRPSASPSIARRSASISASMSSRGDALGHAEVDEGNAAVVHQPVVARVGVAREVAVAVERAEEEAEHDLAEAVAGRVVELAAPPRSRCRRPTRSRARARCTAR